MSDSRRYERKFVVEGSTLREVGAFLRRLPGAFTEAFPPRYVNNLYMDDVMLTRFADHVAGVPYREKTRLRWYGAQFGPALGCRLEFKTRDGEVGCKTSYVLARPLAIEQGFSSGDVRNELLVSGLPQEVGERVRMLRFVLLNRYRRFYYASRNDGFRVTLDAELSSWRVDPFANLAMARHAEDQRLILELKYPASAVPSAERITQLLPFRVAGHSKYLTGLRGVLPVA